ncbi:MAG TPA: DUF309 domain-containing protein [Terracidiphilus sp.]|nr:DUF309 domain-containing protein [Terracidiphilus sp.]
MPLDWETGALAEGLCCYRAGAFFEAHGHWEAVWLASAEPDKTFLQALIQVTAAFHHLRRGNAVGAASLLGAALRRLDAYPAQYAGLAVEPLRQSLREWRDALLAGSSPQLPVPRIL